MCMDVFVFKQYLLFSLLFLTGVYFLLILLQGPCVQELSVNLSHVSFLNIIEV